jgi:hypothetical protein
MSINRPITSKFLTDMRRDWDAADRVDPDWLKAAFSTTPELQTRVEQMVASAGIPPWSHAQHHDSHDHETDVDADVE